MSDINESAINIAAEQAVIGSIIGRNKALDDVAPFLVAQHFAEPFHAEIFTAVRKQVDAGQAATPATLKPFLPVQGPDLDGQPASTMAYLARCVVEAAAPMYVRDTALAIVRAWEVRQVEASARDVLRACTTLEPGMSVLDKLEPIESTITKLRSQRVTETAKRGMGQRYLDALTAAAQRGYVRGVPLCLPEISSVISEPCFEAGNLYGLLSSSGEGKTSLTLQIIMHALEEGHPVQFLSFDQSEEQCVRQMVSQKHGITASRQRAGTLLEKEMEKAVTLANWLNRAPFEVVKCTQQTAAQLVSLARGFVKRFGNGKVPLIVVDHINGVTAENPRAHEGQQANSKSQTFKTGAEVTDSAWLIIQQRSSMGLRRDNPRPISSDLYGGESAKFAYDAIMALYRPEKHKADRVATAATGQDFKKINTVFHGDLEGEAELIGLKVRFGANGRREYLHFDADRTRYQSKELNVSPEPEMDLMGGYQ